MSTRLCCTHSHTSTASSTYGVIFDTSSMMIIYKQIDIGSTQHGLRNDCEAASTSFRCLNLMTGFESKHSYNWSNLIYGWVMDVTVLCDYCDWHLYLQAFVICKWLTVPVAKSLIKELPAQKLQSLAYPLLQLYSPVRVHFIYEKSSFFVV